MFAKLAWTEIKLGLREPTVMVFAIAFPLILLYLLLNSFGTLPDPDFAGVSPTDYYVVEGPVGPCDQLGRILAGVPGGDADGAGALGLCGPQPVGDLHGVAQPAVGQQHRELLPAVAGQKIGLAELALPGRGGLFEQPVSCLVAVPVVERLEMVDVDQGDARRPSGAGGPGQLPRQLGVPAPPVGHPGEAVGMGQAPDLLVEGPNLSQQPQQGAEQQADRARRELRSA
jgi:hypothetical protein